MRIKQVFVTNVNCRHCKQDIRDVLMTYSCIEDVEFFDGYMEVHMLEELDEEEMVETIENCGNYVVQSIQWKESL